MSRGVRHLREIVCVSRLREPNESNSETSDSSDPEDLNQNIESHGDSIRYRRCSSASSVGFFVESKDDCIDSVNTQKLNNSNRTLTSRPSSGRFSRSVFIGNPENSGKKISENSGKEISESVKDISKSIDNSHSSHDHNSNKGNNYGKDSHRDKNIRVSHISKTVKNQRTGNKNLADFRPYSARNYDDLLSQVNAAMLSLWLEAANETVRDLDQWCRTGSNFISLAHYWLSVIPESQKIRLINKIHRRLVDSLMGIFDNAVNKCEAFRVQRFKGPIGREDLNEQAVKEPMKSKNTRRKILKEPIGREISKQQPIGLEKTITMENVYSDSGLESCSSSRLASSKSTEAICGSRATSVCSLTASANGKAERQICLAAATNDRAENQSSLVAHDVNTITESFSNLLHNDDTNDDDDSSINEICDNNYNYNDDSDNSSSSTTTQIKNPTKDTENISQYTAFLGAIFREYPTRMLGIKGSNLFLDYLDILTSDRSSAYRRLLSDVKCWTDVSRNAQSILALRSVALITVWSEIVTAVRQRLEREVIQRAESRTGCQHVGEFAAESGRNFDGFSGRKWAISEEFSLNSKSGKREGNKSGNFSSNKAMEKNSGRSRESVERNCSSRLSRNEGVKEMMHEDVGDMNARRIYQAIRYDYEDVVRYLLGSGKVSPRLLDSQNKSLVFHAVISNRPKILRLLITELGQAVDVNAAASNGNTALHAAASVGSSELVTELLQAKDLRIDVMNEQCDNATPLHIAIMHGHTDLVHKLLESGADTRLQMGDSCAVELAETFDHHEIKELLNNYRK